MVAIVGLSLLWLVFTYNKLVRQKNRLREAWSGIEVQLKRRHDLVPNLVTCVKAYSKHESELLTAVTEHRSAAQNAGAGGASADALGKENVLAQDLGRIIMLAEAYPELKADAQFRQLAKELIEIEDDLQYARRYYNGSVRDQNNLVESFPNVLIAGPLGFRGGDFFEVENAGERIAPDLAEQLKTA